VYRSTEVLEEVQPRNEQQETVESMILLPFRGPDREKILKKLEKTIGKIDNKVITKIIYMGTKLSSQFAVQDKTVKEHKNNLVYKVECPDRNCTETYIGEITRRLSERIKDHSGIHIRWSADISQ